MQWQGSIDDYIDLLNEVEIIGCDTENNGTINPRELWSGQNYGTGISTAIRWERNLYSEYFPFRHPSGNIERQYLGLLKKSLEIKTLIFHNANIDMAALETFGIEITIPPFDTTVLAHLVNEEFPSKKLDWLAKFILKEGKDKGALKKYTDVWGWDDVPGELMAPYACIDAELCYRLWEIFWKDMEP